MSHLATDVPVTWRYARRPIASVIVVNYSYLHAYNLTVTTNSFPKTFSSNEHLTSTFSSFKLRFFFLDWNYGSTQIASENRNLIWASSKWKMWTVKLVYSRLRSRCISYYYVEIPILGLLMTSMNEIVAGSHPVYLLCPVLSVQFFTCMCYHFVFKLCIDFIITTATPAAATTTWKAIALDFQNLLT